MKNNVTTHNYKLACFAYSFAEGVSYPNKSKISIQTKFVSIFFKLKYLISNRLLFTFKVITLKHALQIKKNKLFCLRCKRGLVEVSLLHFLFVRPL
jgi:hypothetical protein